MRKIGIDRAIGDMTRDMIGGIKGLMGEEILGEKTDGHMGEKIEDLEMDFMIDMRKLNMTSVIIAISNSLTREIMVGKRI